MGLRKIMKSSTCKITLIIVVLLSCVGPVWGAQPYKIYTIRTYGNADIVCDSYTVQKGDHIWELLRRKGCIAESDFPRFVSILKRLNPHIGNVDKIYPRQEIVIPLKETKVKDRPSGAGPRYITIPIIPDVLYITYEVRPGESMSRIIAARAGLQWDQLPEDYVQTLKRLNPDISDMNMIHPGQAVRIPELPAKGPTRTVATPGAVAGNLAGKRSLSSATESLPPAKASIPWWHQVVSKTIAGLGGKLLASGECYFPGKDQEDLALDLTAFPVVEMEDGRHLVLKSRKDFSEKLEMAIRSFWDPFIVIQIDPEEPGATVLDKVFRAVSGGKVQKILDLPELDDGIRISLRGDWILSQDDNEGEQQVYYCVTLIENPRERTSTPVVEYLAKENIRVLDVLAEGGQEKKIKSSQENLPEACPVLTIDASDQETLVSRLVGAMGHSYEPRVPFSFAYSGFQVETTANIIHGENALDVVVDFATFYGDAKSAIEAGGLRVVSISPEDEALTIVRNILTAVGIPLTDDPVFFGANRNVFKTTSLTIPGLMTLRPREKMTVLMQTSPDPRIVEFLREKQIRILKIRA